ncbi:MAG TPA: hypothetical protein VF508_08630 [Pyrinomonadaceae bacterium]|jgi:hypothetical protein
MRRLLTPTLLAALLLTSAAAPRAQNIPAPGTPKPYGLADPQTPAGQPAVNRGRLEGSTYSSDYFGVSFSVPQGWVVQDADTLKAMKDTGEKIVMEGATAAKKAKIDAALARSTILLSATKYPPGAPESGFQAQLMCIAERVPTALVKTGDDYIRLMQLSYKDTAAKMELMGPVRAAKVGGIAFTAADFKLAAGSVVLVQKYYVRLTKDYALVLIYSYVDEADLKTFDTFLGTVKFK